jgi:hypothetical protein
MRKRKQYIEFVEMPPLPGRKTRRVSIQSISASSGELGTIYWWPHWRQYVFGAAPAIIFNSQCLYEIHAKLVEMNEEHAPQSAPPLQ